jgi:hypothetical protein
MPASAPSRSAARATQSKSTKNWPRIVGVVSGLAAMIAVAVLLIALALKSWNNRQASAPVAASAPAEAAAPDASSAAASASDRSSYGQVADRVHDMEAKVNDFRKEGDQGLDEGQGLSKPPRNAPAAEPVASTAPSPKATPPPSSTPVVSSSEASGDFSLWPRITLNGILSKGTQGRGIAIVNNQMMSVNETMEGVRLLEVRSTGVLMEFGGDTRFVETGQTLQ